MVLFTGSFNWFIKCLWSCLLVIVTGSSDWFIKDLVLSVGSRRLVLSVGLLDCSFIPSGSTGYSLLHLGGVGRTLWANSGEGPAQ